MLEGVPGSVFSKNHHIIMAKDIFDGLQGDGVFESLSLWFIFIFIIIFLRSDRFCIVYPKAKCFGVD